MNEPCPRCPPFVIRCDHQGELALRVELFNGGATYVVAWHGGGVLNASAAFPTRAEADAEFERRAPAPRRKWWKFWP